MFWAEEQAASISRFELSSFQKMEAAGSSTHEITWCKNSEDRNLKGMEYKEYTIFPILKYSQLKLS
jgi:hypothetical protein